MKISELIDGIRKRDIVLPEFQRHFHIKIKFFGPHSK